MEQRGKETTGTGRPVEGTTEKRGGTMGFESSGFEGMRGGEGMKDREGMKERRGHEYTGDWSSKLGGGSAEMKLTAATAFKEAKNVLGNIMIRTLSGAEKSAAERLAGCLKCLSDWSSGTLESSYSSYIKTSLKYDEAKHALRSLSLAHLDSQELQFVAACKNMCEKKELLKHWVDKKKTLDVSKPKLLMKDREWIESISRFIEVGMSTCHSFHDAFDEAVKDYWFYTEKLDKCLDRKKDFKSMKDKMDTDCYIKYKKWFHECKKDTEKKMIKAKLDVEELRRRIVHFHHDCYESTTETLDFLRVRIPEYERLAKQYVDTPMISTVVENLRKKATNVRDMLEECNRKDKEKLPKFEDKNIIERLVHSRVKMFEGSTGGDISGRGKLGGDTTGRGGDESGRTTYGGDTTGRAGTHTSIRIGADK